MKKFIFMLITMFTFVIGANAQNQKFLDNWSVGTDGGITTNLHDWDTPNGGVWGIQLTKQITPAVAFELSGQLGFNNNANWNVMHSSNAVDNVTAMGSAKVNLMNLFCGYNGKPRLFEIQARGGVGYMRSFYPDFEQADDNLCVSKLGLDFDFNVGKAKAWTLSVRPSVVLKAQNGGFTCDYGYCKRYTHNAVGQLTAGVTYHFKNVSNRNHYYTYPKPTVVTNTVEKVVERVVEKVVEKPVSNPTTNIVEKVVTNDVTNKVSVNFAKNSSELTEDAKSALDKIAVGSTVDVVGMTSPEGSTEVNDVLGKARANVVADYLRNRGINVQSANGGESARAAVVTVLK